MSDVTVTPVTSKADRKAFIDLAYRLNANDPHWVPPDNSFTQGKRVATSSS
jgi:hypothetical protein